MNKEDIWQQLVERHPEWADSQRVVKLRASGLKALIDQAYDEGWKNGGRSQRARSALRDLGCKSPSSNVSLFEKLFGFRK